MSDRQSHPDSANHLPPGRPVEGQLPFGPTRRRFLTQVTAAGVGITVAPVIFEYAATSSASPAAGQSAPHGDEATETIEVNFTINGTAHVLRIDPRVTLLDALREQLGLTGSKKGCDHGQCGACTVLVNGRRINSCLSLAAVHAGDDITTIEGLAQGGELHPMQAAFLNCDGFQCGYCTPGQIMSAVALLKEGCPRDDAGIREMMSGNICRCGAYQGILQAIRQVRDGKKAEASS